MREIKFRCPYFDYENKFQGFRYWGFMEGGFVSPAYLSGCKRGESQQYSGLKDKNGEGKEIYEGDIVLVPSHHTEVVIGDGGGEPNYEYNQICEVFYKDGCFGVNTQRDDYFQKQFYPLLEISRDITDTPLEIIGNIYEDKELLNEKA